jgi:ATP-dependent helicase/nuclease subunit A
MPELFLVEAPKKQTTQPPDADQREQALDITQSWIVEAPAGSGKTGLLIQRYLKLLADPSVDTPEQVLAITFTNKATAELRERVLTQLEAAAHSDAPPANEFDRLTQPLALAVLERDRALHWDLLDQPARLNIRTIDSVCAEIARSLPILSGSGGRQAPVPDADPLYALAAHRTFLQLGGNDPALDAALRLILLHRDGNLSDCEALLGEMLARRDQWGELVPLGRRELDDAYLDSTVLPLLQRALEHAIRAAIRQLARTIPRDLLERLSEAAAEMAHLDGHGGRPSPIALCAGRDAIPRLTHDDLAHWRALMHLLVSPSQKTWRRSFNSNHVGFLTTVLERERLKSLVEELHHRDDLLHAIARLGALPPATYPAEQWTVAKALFRILSRALIELKLVFAERRECDFTEIALAAQTALRSGLGHETAAAPQQEDDILAAAFGLRLQHLLVDEMQDTSSGQYELLQMLTQGWDGCSQTVFLVGDPKQSIYLFRQARVERFLHTMRSRTLGDLPLGCLRLTANFRSQAGLVEQFNQDFAHLFPAADGAALHPEAVPFVAAAPVRSPSPHSAGRIWHPNVLPAARSNPLANAQARQTLRRDEALTIRRIVEQWRAKPLPPNRQAQPGKAADPWKIAVLVRSRSHAAEIVRAFQQQAGNQQPGEQAAPIPFRAIDLDSLQQRPEVLDLFALTRALLHPADRVAWLAILRAPWCGFGLPELHQLTGADDPAFAERTIPDLLSERGHLLDDSACRRLERLWPILQAATAMDARIPTAQRVERTWRSLGGDTYLTLTERTNARRYLQLLDELEQQTGAIDITLLGQRLDDLYAAPSTEPNPVDLLTIHKSKGLEWDLVLVPALDRIGKIDSARLLSWIELGTADSEPEDDDAAFEEFADEALFDELDEESLEEEANQHQAARILLAPIRSRGEASRALNTWIDGIRREREAAERKRLLYVACTRAREELHLFASPELNEKGGITPRSGSLLQSFWPAAHPHFAAAAAAAADPTPRPTLVPTAQEAAAEDATQGLSLAAAADAHSNQPHPNSLLYRLPLDFDPEARLRSSRSLTKSIITANASSHAPAHGTSGGSDTTPSTSNSSKGAAISAPAPSPLYDRIEGSFSSRGFGTVVHAFLEKLAQALAAAQPAATLLATLPTWAPRIAALLRAENLPPAQLDRLTQRVLTALETTLRDPEGLWLLSAHLDAASESALTSLATDSDSAHGDGDGSLRSIRTDRSFRAGPSPLSPGSSCLWIIDYKTTTHNQSTGDLTEFLRTERERYAPQLEAYARILKETASESNPELRLALYYPLLPQLLWWSPTSA